MVNVDTLNKLVNSLIGDKYGLNITFSESNRNNIYDLGSYDITVEYDIEKYNIAGNDYDPEYAETIWSLSDEIDSALGYLGRDDIFIDKIFYKPISTDLYDRVVKTLKDNLPEINHRINKEGKYDVKIKNISIGFHDDFYDATIIVTMETKNIPTYNVTDMEMKVWSIIGDYVDTDSFLHKIYK